MVCGICLRLSCLEFVCNSYYSCENFNTISVHVNVVHACQKYTKTLLLIAIALFVQDNLSVLDFVDKDIGDVEPVKPPSLEQTPFKLVEEVKDLKELAAKLKSIDEFAVKSDFCDYVLLINNAVVQPYCSSFFFSAF